MNRWSGLAILLISASGFIAHGYETRPKKLPYSIIREYNDRYTPGTYGSSLLNPYRSLGLYFANSYLRNPVPIEDEFSFEQLVEIIDEKKLITIESVIQALPDHMKTHNYVLMYRSRSLQEASPEAPRALVYTPTASFILSFNGGGKQLGANTIETIQFRQETKKFEFRELVFDGVNQPRVSKANPAKCMECHQSPGRVGVDLRPNWEPYNIWIGAYGSDTGALDNEALRDEYGFRKRLRPQDEEAFAEQAQEFELFRRFIEDIAPNHPRYSHLGQFNIRGPTDLTSHLSFWNAMRVVRLMMEEEEVYEHYKEAIALAVRCYSGPSAYKKSHAFQWHLKTKVPQYFNESDMTLLQTFSAKLTYIFEPLGIDTSDWSMDFGTKARFAFRERFGTPSSTQQVFRSVWQHLVPEKDQFKGVSCTELEERMVTKLDQAFAKGFQQKQREMRIRKGDLEPSAQKILQRCMKCHVNNRESWIPYIPFDRPQELAKNEQLLHKIQYRTSDMATRREQMPPAGRLSAKEHETLMKYLEEIRDED